MRLITEELQSQPDDAPPLTYDKACLAAGYDFKARVTDNDCEHLPFPGVAAKKRGEHQDSHTH